MKLEDLEHIFRHQLTPPNPEDRTETLSYLMIDGESKVVHQFDYNQGLAKLLPSLDNFVFEGYRDKTPIFIKPEYIQPL